MATNTITAPTEIQIPDYSKYRFLYFYIGTNDSYSGDSFIIPKVLYREYKKYVRVQATTSNTDYWLHLSMQFRAGVVTLQRMNLSPNWDRATINCYGIR